MTRPIGKTYDGGNWYVDTESFQDYARATDDTNKAYFGDSPIAPPMFHVRPMIALMLHCANDPELQIDMLRLVHGEHRMNFLEPLLPGDELLVGATLAAVDEKSSGTIFTFGMHLDRKGQRVVEGTTAYFVRSANPPAKEEPKEAPKTEAPAEAKADPAPAAKADEPKGKGKGKGKEGAPAKPAADAPRPTVTVPQQVAADQALRYALASGDDNKIHTDEAVAKQAGLPRTILHGLCTLAFAQRDLIQRAGGDPRKLASLGARFTGLVFPGDLLQLHTFETGKDVRFETMGPSGKPVLLGEAKFR